MRRTLTAVTAAIFATALTFPAFAQVGVGISGNANMGDHSAHAGANADVGNSDAERTETASPTDSSTTKTIRHHRKHHSESSTTSEADSNRGVGADAGVGANVGGMGTHAGAGAHAGRDNSPSSGY